MGIFDKKTDSIFGDNPDGGQSSQKKAADFSDVSGGASSSAPAADTGQTYTVKSGDSLSKIAKHFYGDGNKWHKIYEANRDKIKNPDLIHPGQELTIPAA
jgi:nucleoid-associated protein YgaU